MKTTTKQPTRAVWRFLQCLVSWIPRTKDDWKMLAMFLGVMLLLFAAIGGPILIGILKLWALFKYVLS